jgi:hypothetical protein
MIEERDREGERVKRGKGQEKKWNGKNRTPQKKGERESKSGTEGEGKN